jgi:hypothetical protein
MQPLASYVNLLWSQLEPLVEKELLTLLEHLSSHPVFSGVRVVQTWVFFLTIALSLLLWLTASDYPCGILWPLHCLSFFHLRLLITPVVSCGHCIVSPSLTYSFWLPLWYLVAIALSLLLWFTASDYPCGILWPLHCFSFFDLWLLITPVLSCCHCIVSSSLTLLLNCWKTIKMFEQVTEYYPAGISV